MKMYKYFFYIKNILVNCFAFLMTADQCAPVPQPPPFVNFVLKPCSTPWNLHVRKCKSIVDQVSSYSGLRFSSYLGKVWTVFMSFISFWIIVLKVYSGSFLRALSVLLQWKSSYTKSSVNVLLHNSSELFRARNDLFVSFWILFESHCWHLDWFFMSYYNFTFNFSNCHFWNKQLEMLFLFYSHKDQTHLQ